MQMRVNSVCDEEKFADTAPEFKCVFVYVLQLRADWTWGGEEARSPLQRLSYIL